MAFKSKDGKNFGNRQQQKAYDERVPKGKGASHEEPDGDEPNAGLEDGEDVSGQSIHEVVAEHGPAHKVVVTHDHEAGKHEKVSHHGNNMAGSAHSGFKGEKSHGVVHRSQHGSAAEAHQAATQAGAPEEEQGNPEMGGANSVGSPGAPSDYGIPGLG